MNAKRVTSEQRRAARLANLVKARAVREVNCARRQAEKQKTYKAHGQTFAWDPDALLLPEGTLPTLGIDPAGTCPYCGFGGCGRACQQ